MKVATLDNPGWLVTVDVGDALVGRVLAEECDEQNWIHCSVVAHQFVGAGGPSNLREILSVLRSWLTEQT